ncbi:pol-related protein [Clonorchis sinensis]|uniref:Pol-related protein n=1 Tax=Clonorchis sinensis TaxID=79923 RepID=G7YDS2_CLOSI|nr:pol-related protein [Clonorchis sinensis]
MIKIQEKRDSPKARQIIKEDGEKSAEPKLNKQGNPSQKVKLNPAKMADLVHYNNTLSDPRVVFHAAKLINEPQCALNGPKNTLNPCRFQSVTTPWRIVTAITTLNDQPKMFTYGAVHRPKYGVGVTQRAPRLATKPAKLRTNGYANVLYYKNESSYTEYKITNLNGFRQTQRAPRLATKPAKLRTNGYANVLYYKNESSYTEYKITNLNGFRQTWSIDDASCTVKDSRIDTQGRGLRLSFPGRSFSGHRSPERHKLKKGVALLFKFSVRGVIDGPQQMWAKWLFVKVRRGMQCDNCKAWWHFKCTGLQDDQDARDVIVIERVQRAATKMYAGLKSVDYETRLAVLDLFPLEYRRLRVDFILTYALFEQGLANRFFTVDPANTRQGHGERQPLNDKKKTDPENWGESLDPVYQSGNP